MTRGKYGPHVPEKTYVPHAYKEQLFDTGEVLLNYATAGSNQQPALVLIPGQTESWWGYEAAMDLLKDTSRFTQSTCAARAAPAGHVADTRWTTSEKM
jgi:hypothetical protein